MIKLKDGQVWKTRDGHFVMLNYDPHYNWYRESVWGFVYCNDNPEDTRYQVFGEWEHDFDLMELVSE